jgi:2-polyprenyl-3-methyl-5-hydroxy-6-metoxy-1,4-benzoquinol methylase
MWREMGGRKVLGDKAVVELIVELLPSGGRVLDVGCGGGHILRALARRGVKGIGVDLRPYGGAPCRRLHAEEISTLGEQFDLVYTLHALHEFDAPQRFPTEARGVLCPGGVLLIMDWVRGAKTGVQERYSAIETVVGWMASAGFEMLRQEVRGQTMVLAGRVPIFKETG